VRITEGSTPGAFSVTIPAVTAILLDGHNPEMHPKHGNTMTAEGTCPCKG
jgi:hypothetical protein